jgi:hypothetical protein
LTLFPDREDAVEYFGYKSADKYKEAEKAREAFKQDNSTKKAKPKQQE